MSAPVAWFINIVQVEQDTMIWYYITQYHIISYIIFFPKIMLAWFINIVQAEEALRQAALSYGHLPVTNKCLDTVFSPNLFFGDTVITL